MNSFIPGKIIIAGEHAVVEGELALVASIDRGVRVRVVEGGQREFGKDKKGLVGRAIEIARGDESIGVEIESELPVGSGLGSSAAVGAAVIRAVREHLGKPINKEELFNLTMEVEQLAHNGKSSGVDPAAVVYGGLIAYRKGEEIKKLQMPRKRQVLIVLTGKASESTGEMIEIAANNPEKERIFGEIGQVVEEMRARLVVGEEVIDLINKNGVMLEELGVVSEGARGLAEELRKMGYGAKIAGAGGIKSGAGVMTVWGEDFARAKILLDNRHIKYFETIIGG